MLLTIDIGNTNIVIGAYEKNQLKGHWRLSSTITRTSDESWIIVKLLFESDQLQTRQIDGVVIASVVPNLSEIFALMSVQYLDLEPVIVNSSVDTGIKILYKTPESVGADRICNAVAGFHRFGGPLIVVDFGTATTFDVVTENAEYLGGIIVPGIEMSANFLHYRTAQLPKVSLKFPEHLIGTTTVESIQSGLMFGGVQMVDGLVRRLREELHAPAKVVATGGLAGILQEKSSEIKIIEPYLTLDGLKLIYERVRGHSLRTI